MMDKNGHEYALLLALKWIAMEDKSGNPVMARKHAKAIIKENKFLKAKNEDLKIQLKQDTKPAKPGLPPCPFCGSTNLYTTSMPRFPGLPRSWDGSMSYTVACGGCAAHGGWEKSLSSARRTWAMRAGEKP